MTNTTLINISKTHIPQQYKNAKYWCENNNHVYIGRANSEVIDGNNWPEISSDWCNPYKINKYNTREQVIEKYKHYIINKLIENNYNLCLLFKKLRGKVLGCWCVPLQCHGEVLIQIINAFPENYEPCPDFSQECNICNVRCDEMSGWKCDLCHNCWCDEHNENTCECVKNILVNIF